MYINMMQETYIVNAYILYVVFVCKCVCVCVLLPSALPICVFLCVCAYDLFSPGVSLAIKYFLFYL